LFLVAFYRNLPKTFFFLHLLDVGHSPLTYFIQKEKKRQITIESNQKPTNQPENKPRKRLSFDGVFLFASG